MKPKDPHGPRTPAAKSVKPRSASTATRQSRADTATPASSKVKQAPLLTQLKIPPILLEGDAPPVSAISGPGQRYALNSAAAAAPAVSAGPELPEAYGTRQLFLSARDPHWLYAHWDFSREELKRCNALSADGHLALRVFRGAAEGEALSQIPLHPESRTWFVPVPAAGAKYVAELGYRDAAGRWVTLARSGATFTPPDSLSEDTSMRFATIPPEVPFSQLLEMVHGAVREHLPLVEAMQQMRAQGFRDLPAPEEVQGPWTPAQEKALAEVISIDHVKRIWIGSLEITELIRRQFQEQLPSFGAAPWELASSAMGAFPAGAMPGVSSPPGGAERRRGFWFNVNAELIIYGATELDATVTIGDRPIKLRPDGSFSLRFALPEGDYSLLAAAYSADGAETRGADLRFSRQTVYHGEVGAHPPEKDLMPPPVSAVA